MCQDFCNKIRTQIGSAGRTFVQVCLRQRSALSFLPFRCCKHVTVWPVVVVAAAVVVVVVGAIVVGAVVVGAAVEAPQSKVNQWIAIYLKYVWQNEDGKCRYI